MGREALKEGKLRIYTYIYSQYKKYSRRGAKLGISSLRRVHLAQQHLPGALGA